MEFLTIISVVDNICLLHFLSRIECFSLDECLSADSEFEKRKDEIKIYWIKNSNLTFIKVLQNLNILPNKDTNTDNNFLMNYLIKSKTL